MHRVGTAGSRARNWFARHFLQRSKLALLALLAAMAPDGAARAQDPAADATPVTIGFSTTLASTVLGETRTLRIHLPADYEAGSRRYPVLYLLDPDSHFAHVSAAVDFLARTDQAPPMIVVGIVNTRRTRDLTPAGANASLHLTVPAAQLDVLNDYPGAGGADTFLAFLKTELIPHVESRYRTAPFRVLAGHSFGGLFAAHVLAADPTLFNAYLAASPSFWWDDEALVKRVAATPLATGPGPRWLYMATGGREGMMITGLEDFRQTLELQRPAGLRYRLGILPDDTHQTLPYQFFYDGLRWLFDSYALPDAMVYQGDIGAIERHFAEAGQLYGIDLAPTEETVNTVGYRQLEYKRPQRAVELFQRNVELHPGSANARDSLADGLEALGRDQDALQSREQAVRLAEANGDPLLDTFRIGLERLRARLASGQ